MASDVSNQLIRVTKKRYLLQMNQEEIAKSENLSKATVSRLLKKAETLGYVTFRLNIPSLSAMDLEAEIKEKFALKHVFVASAQINDERVIAHDVVDAAASYLNTIITSGAIIGVSWGNTLSLLSRNLKKSNATDVTVVQLNGGISKNVTPTGAESIARNFAENYSGTSYILPVPSFVDNKRIVEALKEDSKIREVFSLIHQSEIAIFSIGSLNPNSILITSGYFSQEEYMGLKKKNYVGDICSRYFKKDGSYSDKALYDRVIGISLEEIKEKKHSIGIVIGQQRTDALLGALNGGYINTLFTDELVAREILSM